MSSTQAWLQEFCSQWWQGLVVAGQVKDEVCCNWPSLLAPQGGSLCRSEDQGPAAAQLHPACRILTEYGKAVFQPDELSQSEELPPGTAGQYFYDCSRAARMVHHCHRVFQCHPFQAGCKAEFPGPLTRAVANQGKGKR